MLEHFTRRNGEIFIRECVRVLKPNGILRVVVPDLEQIVRNYLASLESSIIGDSMAAENYRWMMLEMYDQTVRHSPGGEAAAFLAQSNLINKQFVVSRWGAEALQNFDSSSRVAHPRKVTIRSFLKRIRDAVSPSQLRELLVKLALGDKYPVYSEAVFRNSGEIHLWMYDQFSLGQLMKSMSLVQIAPTTADRSGCIGWKEFQLDCSQSGQPHKPDSLYMEGRKPLD